MTFNCPDCTFYSDDKDESQNHIDEHLCILESEFANSEFGEEDE